MYALLLSSAAWALPAPPPPLSLSPAEQAQLSAGEVVVRWSGPGRQSIAVVDIDATVEQVMDAAMDLKARKAEVGGIKSCSLYRDEPGIMGADWVMGFAGLTVDFSILYEYDRSGGYTVYQLDPTRENGLKRSDGSYQVYAVGNQSRLVYRTLSESGRSAPEWIRKRLAFRSSREMLKGIEARAEASK